MLRTLDIFSTNQNKYEGAGAHGRKRMGTMNKFFKENGDCFGFGIYIGNK